MFDESVGTNGWHDVGYSLTPNGYCPLFRPEGLPVFEPVDDFCVSCSVAAVGIGGSRRYSTPDLVRAVRRCSENDEAMALHIPDRKSVQTDECLRVALAAVRLECERLGVRYEADPGL